MIGPSVTVQIYYVLFATLILSTMSQDLSNLGNEISAAVNRRLAPLQNLGSRITEQVNRDLALNRPAFYPNYVAYNYADVYGGAPDMSDLGAQISARVHENIRSTEDLNHHIQQNIHRELAPLNDLGQRIQESVNKGLEPVRAMELVYKMMNGVGGTTIATYLPSGKQLIIKNYQPFQCSGNIAEDTGKCDSDLKPFVVKDRQDYCLRTTSYSILNNQICVGGDRVSIINNQLNCESYSNRPVLLMSLNDFQKLCEKLSIVQYKYIADYTHPYHVEVPNKNPHVKCENSEKGVCVFKRNLVFAGNTNVVINNHFSYSQYGY